MLADGRRLGAHLPLGHGMVRAADRAAEIGATTIQVFTDNPTSWRRRPALPKELPAFRDRLAAHGIAPIAVHAPYLVNLAGHDPALVDRSAAVLANELRVAAAYGAALVNVHAGSHLGDGPDAGIDRLAAGVRATFDAAEGDAPGVVLVIENGSGGGYGLGASVAELAAIDAAIAGCGVPRERFGFCLDAAHLWGAGYPIDEPEGVDAVLDEFDAGIGLDRLRLVHLNDSRSERGSRMDRHEHVGAGRIGGRGLARLLTHPALAHVTTILETPGMEQGYDAVNLQRARDLAAGRPLEPLPPEAFLLTSGRNRSAPAEETAAEPADHAPHDPTAEDAARVLAS
jgi:deoxyribonuclease IV